MKIPKYLYGNPIEEWGSQWKNRLLPSARSKVLQKWNASGKKPKPESSNEYTKRRVKEETKRTWRSDVADIAHGIGEGVLALHPYTAIPYYGAKVGLDFLNGTYGWHTALNASVPLFHLAPQAVGLREATNVALEDAANAGSKTARNWRVAREIKLATKNKPKYTKVPSKNLFRTQVYKGGEITDPYSNFVTTDPLYAANYGKVTPYIFESRSVAKAKEPMMGYSDPVTMDMFIYNNTKRNPNATAIIGHDAVTGEFTPSKGTEILNMNPKNLYPIRTSDSPTSLKFFERKPSKSVTREYVQSPRDITSDVGNLIAEGSERSAYASKSNPNIVYKIEDAPLDDIKNIKIRKEVADDIIAPETTVGYYNRNGKYYRVTLLDKYKSWDPDDFDINYSPELDLEIIDVLRKAKWNVELGTYNGAPYARTASKNGIKIGNLEYFNWGRDSNGNLKLIDLYVYSLKQGGKMNTLLFLKNGSSIHIKKKNRGKFTDYCGGKVTDSCIKRAKASGNPTLVKRATFALNARRWKHKDGGKAFVNGVSILDSNPNAYKYVKKKYKMALEGAKLTFGLRVGNFLNSDLGQFAVNASGQFVNGIWLNKQLNKIKNELNQWKKSYINSITPEDYSLQVAAEEQQLMQENPDYNSSPIVQAYKNNILANNSLAAAKLKAEQEANQVIANYQLNNNLNSFNWGNLLSLGLGLAGQYLSNKKLAT